MNRRDDVLRHLVDHGWSTVPGMHPDAVIATRPDHHRGRLHSIYLGPRGGVELRDADGREFAKLPTAVPTYEVIAIIERWVAHR